MGATRIDTKKLKAAIEQAERKVDEAKKILAPYLVILTDKERAEMPRARDKFEPAGRQLARAIPEHAKIAAAVDFDAEAVIEDLDNVAALSPLAEKTAELTQQIADSKLTWLAEAWSPSLAVYAVAKAGARVDGKLRTLIEPLAAIFATRRARREPETPETP